MPLGGSLRGFRRHRQLRSGARRSSVRTAQKATRNRIPSRVDRPSQLGEVVPALLQLTYFAERGSPSHGRAPCAAPESAAALVPALTALSPSVSATSLPEALPSSPVGLSRRRDLSSWTCLAGEDTTHRITVCSRKEDRCIAFPSHSQKHSFLRSCSAAPPLSSRPRRRRPRPSRPRPRPTSPVNLNTATLTDLQALPGVGAATAKLIVEHREKNGGFKKVEELMNIKGIGEKSFLKLKPMVTVAPAKAERQDDAAKAR